MNADQYVEEINSRNRGIHITAFNYFVQEVHRHLSGFHLPADQFAYRVMDLSRIREGVLCAGDTVISQVPDWQKIIDELHQYFTDQGFICALTFYCGDVNDPELTVKLPTKKETKNEK